jgi:NDP-sugar pyrophosphorylase family protein
MRGLIGGRSEPSFLFTGVSVFSPEIFQHIPVGEVVSIIPVLVDLMRRGMPVGGELIDEGVWFDIGNIPSYMGVHRILNEGAHAFSYLPADWLKPVQNGARICPGASIAGCSAVAAGADVGEDAVLENVIVWPDAKVDAGMRLRDSVVTSLSVCQCDCAPGSFGA